MSYGGIENRIVDLLQKSVARMASEMKLTIVPLKDVKPELEIPKEKSHGDLSSNIAMRISKYAKMPPIKIAEILKSHLDLFLKTDTISGAFDSVEVKAPGFINFSFSRKYLSKVLLEIKRTKDNYGRSAIGSGTRLQIEFVSANPTGPLTIAHGRQAAIGDSLANIMEFLGYKVTREYYLNDEGTQMDILANSIRVRYRNLCGITEDLPKDAYKGDYIIDIAKDFKKEHGKKFADEEDLKRFRQFGLVWILNDIKKDLKDFGVKFNVWYSQKALRKAGKVEKAIKFLKEKGHIYEQEGAVWFRSTDFGDDKDRVVKKSDGNLTYLAPDIAYHLEKYRRGFKKIVDIWGPDHHGYVPRMKAAIQALGYDEKTLSVIIVQLATLYRNGQVVSMSTRAGEFVTLREVMDEVGKDVSRFCFIMRRTSSHLDFDLDIVKKESMENPVYYIQYAHARICSIMGYCRKSKISAKFDSDLLKEPEEIEILRALRIFPDFVAMSGKTLEPYVVLQYLHDLAGLFHSFYNKHRVVGDDHALSMARLVMVDCVRIVLANGLRLLGVSLPKKM